MSRPDFSKLQSILETLPQHLQQVSDEFDDGDLEHCKNCLFALAHDARLLARKVEEAIKEIP